MDKAKQSPMAPHNVRMLNELARQAEASQSSGVAYGSNVGGVGVHGSPFGQVVDQDSFRYTDYALNVVLVDEGPEGATTTDPGTYYAREIYLLDTGDEKQVWILGGGFWGLVYNIPEIISGGRNLQTFDAGTSTDDVQVDQSADVIRVTQLDGVNQDEATSGPYLFGAASSGTGNRTISGKVTGNAAGNGKYTGKSFTDRTTDVPASGNLAESDFGTLAGSNDCLILNPVELGSSTTGHDVTATVNTDHFAIYFTGRWASTNSDGTKVVHAMLFFAGCE